MDGLELLPIPASDGASVRRLDLPRSLSAAVEAARAAGELLRRDARRRKRVSAATRHDVKLELDVRCQRAIERILRSRSPGWTVLGEEGTSGNEEDDVRWVVDPIDGTVNYAHGIPHVAVAIALQARESEGGEHRTQLGVICDPFCRELWTAVRGGPALLDGKRIAVSRRTRLQEALVTTGFAKSPASMAAMLPVFEDLVRRVRKIRIMGSAALAMAYVASGRLDAYVEASVRLWDIAAGQLLLERAGGSVWMKPATGVRHGYRVLASSGNLLLRRSPAVARFLRS